MWWRREALAAAWASLVAKRQAESSPEADGVSAAPTAAYSSSIRSTAAWPLQRRQVCVADSDWRGHRTGLGDRGRGRVVLLDRFVDRGILVYGPDGKLINDVPLPSKLDLGA